MQNIFMDETNSDDHNLDKHKYQLPNNLQNTTERGTVKVKKRKNRTARWHFTYFSTAATLNMLLPAELII